jgi:hypothetical protein
MNYGLKYHVSINSVYIKILKVYHFGETEMKCTIQYFSKPSGQLMTTEKGVKISYKALESWEIWES